MVRWGEPGAFGPYTLTGFAGQASLGLATEAMWSGGGNRVLLGPRLQDTRLQENQNTDTECTENRLSDTRNSNALTQPGAPGGPADINM